MTDYTTSKAVLRTAYFTDHVTGKTAIAVELDAPSYDKAVYTVSSQENYGRMWLDAVIRVLDRAIYPEFTGNVDIVLISSQKECAIMAEKIIRMWIKLLGSKKQTSEKIRAIVAAAGHYHGLPNDDYYAIILEILLKCKDKFAHFSIDAQRISTPNTDRVFNLAKNMVAPNYVITKKKKKIVVPPVVQEN